jgi:hypothetical protein
VLEGWRVLRFTWTIIEEYPDRVIETVRKALQVTDSIEAFVQARILPPYRPIFAAFRELVATEFPQLAEGMRGGTDAYPGVPVYRLNRIVVTVSPTKKGITFNFTDGVSFDDPYGLLEGVGTKTRNVRWSNPEQFDPDPMRHYLRQAVKADSR